MQHSTQQRIWQCRSACLLLTEQLTCRASSKHVTSHMSNNWPARKVYMFYFPAADLLKCNQLFRSDHSLTKTCAKTVAPIRKNVASKM